MADTGLIVTVVIFCLIFAWIITFSVLAMVLKKPIFEKLSIIGPLGHKVHLASKGIGFADQFVHGMTKRGHDVTRYPSTEELAEQYPSTEQLANRETVQGGYYGYYNPEEYDPDF